MSKLQFLRGAIAMSLQGSGANEAISGAWGIASLLKGIGNDAREKVARNDKVGGRRETKSCVSTVRLPVARNFNRKKINRRIWPALFT